MRGPGSGEERAETADVTALVDSDSLTVDFVERAPIERLNEPFDSFPRRLDWLERF
jgi:hypothetical protein